MRARIVGGRDVTPDQVFQVMKYLKASGQSLDMDSLLTTFIAMPDIRGSTFGNQMNMLIRTITGGGTQASLQALERAGLGRITDRTAVRDHTGSSSSTRRCCAKTRSPGSPRTSWGRKASCAAPVSIPEPQAWRRFRPPCARRSARTSPPSTSPRMMVGQWREWSDQTGIARLANLTGEARQQHAGGSSWHQLNTARSALQDVLGSVGENFKTLLNPALESATNALKKLASWIDPKTGSPAAQHGRARRRRHRSVHDGAQHPADDGPGGRGC